MATTTSPKGMKSLKDVVAQLEDAMKDVGERISGFFDEIDVRRRMSDAVDAIDDLRLEAIRRVQGEPATKSFDEMTVRELHELASEREIPGRSSMDKAELIDALRKS